MFDSDTERPQPVPRVTIPPGFDGYWLAANDPTPSYFRAGDTLPVAAVTAYQRSGQAVTPGIRVELRDAPHS